MIVATLPNPIKYKAVAPGNYLLKRKSQIEDLFYSLDGKYYLRELYVRSEKVCMIFQNTISIFRREDQDLFLFNKPLFCLF